MYICTLGFCSVGPPESLSSVMPTKSKEHRFSSQVDVILAVSKKVAEARSSF